MVPTSAISGDGMGDLMAMMVLMCQRFLFNRLMWSREMEATVLEVCLLLLLFICCLLVVYWLFTFRLKSHLGMVIL